GITTAVAARASAAACPIAPPGNARCRSRTGTIAAVVDALDHAASRSSMTHLRRRLLACLAVALVLVAIEVIRSRAPAPPAGPDPAEPPRTRHPTPDATPPYTTRPARERSPSLRQHAHNPVDWYPWGEEAFAKARSERKPILLSVGYSTCHWCHVME